MNKLIDIKDKKMQVLTVKNRLKHTKQYFCYFDRMECFNEENDEFLLRFWINGENCGVIHSLEAFCDFAGLKTITKDSPMAIESDAKNNPAKYVYQFWLNQKEDIIMKEIYEVRSNEPILRKMATIINKKQMKLPFDTKPIARVKSIWFDEGAHMMWTTIVVGEGFDSWQFLNPRENKMLLKLDSDASDEYIETIINLIIKVTQDDDVEDMKNDLAAIDYVIEAANNDAKARKIMEEN